MQKIIIVGDRPFAEVAHSYFTWAGLSPVAFCVERDYIQGKGLLGLPVVPMETIQEGYSPDHHFFFVAVVYTDGNRLRERLYKQMLEKGYPPARYRSKYAFIDTCDIGYHHFIFENNVIQYRVRIGDNCIFWSGNHIGHHTTIGDHCFFSSHVVISGLCEIGDRCFFGVNSTVIDRVKIGDDCIIGAGALVLKDVPAGTTVIGVWKGMR